jgi:hypothetical protein
MWLLLILSLRLHPEVINTSRAGDFMESFTLLDGDQILFGSSTKDLFIGIQPHHIMGEVYSSIASNSSDRILHRPGDRFRVQRQDLLLTYRQRGGAVVDSWQIPSDLCLDHNVFSTQQREAVIQINDTFTNSTRICWFLHFRRPVEFSISFPGGPVDSLLQIGDTSHLQPGSALINVRPGGARTGTLGTQQLVVLKAEPGYVNLTIRISSPIPFGDWTDRPSLFADRGQTAPANLPLYITSIRDVKLWIWTVLAGLVLFVLLFTAAILFFRPLRKLGLATGVTSTAKAKAD